MSADLQFRLQDLPPIQLSSLKLNLPPPHQQESSSEESCRTHHSEQVDDCVTPTSSEHRIPAILTCPPAPKKQRHSSPSCKRTLHEFQFFDFVASEEIDSFFTSSYEFINRSKKRRCLL